MARNPYYSGSIASTVQSAYGPSTSTADLLHQQVTGGGMDSLLGKLFYSAEADPEAQQAKYYKAQAGKVNLDAEEKRRQLQIQQQGRDAVSGFSSDLNEYTQRVGGPQELGANASKLLPVVLGRYREALAAGDEDTAKTLSPVLKAFLASTGDANAIVTANSMDGKYLGKGESPTIGRQDEVREDEQSFEKDWRDADRKLDEYNFNRQSEDRRYNTNVDASTQRRGQDKAAGTAARGQDIAAEGARQGRVMDVWSKAYALGRPAPSAAYTQTQDQVDSDGKKKRVVTTRTPISPKPKVKLKYNPKTGLAE